MQRVDKKIPMPAAPKRGRPQKYPWDSMAVGDSFIINAPAINNAQSHCSQAGRRTGRKFIVRPMRDGKFRVWRTE